MTILTDKKTNNSKGFTLIEMLIAISIFSLVLIVATNIYLVVNNSQRKIVTMQKIQDDTRFLFEAIAQEIRLGTVNYDFYASNGINLHPALGGTANSILAINNSAGEEIFFRYSTPNVQYCAINSFNTCDLTDDSLWQSVTPAGVEVEDLRFIISPSADPFAETSPVGCNSDADCDLGYECQVDNLCKYDSDGGNFQPKVRFIMKSRGIGKDIAEESEITMQTTLSSRIFSSAVQNLNYE